MKVYIIVITFVMSLLMVGSLLAQAPDPPAAAAPPADVQALQSQLAGAGCNAALNAAAGEIIKLRQEVARLQGGQMQSKSGATKK